MSEARKPRRPGARRSGSSPKGTSNGTPPPPQLKVVEGLWTPEDELEIAGRAHRYQIHEEAQHRARMARDLNQFDSSKLPDINATYGDFMKAKDPEHKYIVDDWLTTGGNVLLVASYKSGKSTVALNLEHSLSTGEPFLGQFDTAMPDGNIAYMNYEVVDWQMRDWRRKMGLEESERSVHPLNLRDINFPLSSPAVQDWLVRWLVRWKVSFWIVDPAAKAWGSMVDNENNNSQIAVFTDILDRIKARAGVQGLLLTAHTGRAKFDDGDEHSRGATRLEDWMDTGWYLTKDKQDKRSLRSIGRGTNNEAIVLQWDNQTYHYSASGVTRKAAQLHDGAQEVVDVIAIEAGLTTRGLRKAVGGENVQGKIFQALDEGLIRRELGERRAQLHYLTDKGRELAERKVKVPESIPPSV